ncbi:mitochondrial ribosomal protein S25-domain-containing protein [Mycena pura]|uniref:Small ribosomal subunit protein mS23 n=1 Tax=Mycena pura TaxID=153505 RepID=A0AAD6URR5_9AGAR|nr:mitochondrial ribosomal protein S25-domain-containing protein [Mycena pura]
MGRRIASQVHHQVARLMRGNLVRKEPIWYQPVLNFPPLPLPAKAPPQRTSYDQKLYPQSKLRRPKNRPLPIHYIEDDIRRQFYADHPFEAFRPTTLVEKGDIEMHEVNGEGWTRLRQRGRNPTPEDAIQFALNQHQTYKKPLSEAYAMAVAQFRALRSEHHIATTFAVMEAEELGGMFVRGEIEHAFEKEKRALATWETLEDIDEGSLTARKRWKMIAERHVGETDWSRGVQYVRMWQAGNRVDYSPAIMRPLGDEDALLDGEDADVEAEDLEYESEDEGAGSGSGILTAEELDRLVENHIVREDDSVAMSGEEENMADTDSSVALQDVVVEDPKPRSEEAEFFNFTKKS